MSEVKTVLSHDRRILSPPAGSAGDHFSDADDDLPSRSNSPSPSLSRRVYADHADRFDIALNSHAKAAQERRSRLGGGSKNSFRNSFRDFRQRSISSIFGRNDSSKRRKSQLSRGNTGSMGSIISSLSAPSLGKELSFLAASLYSSRKKRMLETMQEEKAMASVPQSAIEMHRLSQYFHERQRKKILLKGEYLYVKRATEEHTTEFATRSENMHRNAYPDVLPFDYNRVILSSLPNIPSSHYINASYVDSFYQPKAYVVAQACKDKFACEEFWRMVWEQNSGCIVMLTKVFDYMKVMCLQYFPVSRFTYGDFELETIDMKVQSFYVIRTIHVRRHSTQEDRIVFHCHYTDWGYNGFPYVSALLDFRRKVRLCVERNNLGGPLVVHCSDGGGRSGVFLCIDANLELAQEEGLVDVFGYCKTLLNSRQHTVGSFDQYVFMYEVLVEAIRCNIKPFSMYELPNMVTKLMTRKNRQTMENEYAKEFKLLEQLTPPLEIGNCAGGHRLENRGKNRNVMVVPPDHARPYLSTLHGESKDYTYINAVHIDGFQRKNEWIITEWPKPNTVDSFWALIYDHSIHTLINLTTEDLSMKHYPKFLHDRGRNSYGPFSVEVTQVTNYPYMTSHTIKIGKRTFMLSDIMMGDSSQYEQDVRVCLIFSLRIWPHDNQLPVSTSGFIDMIKHARSWRERNPDRKETKSTVVMSHNGVSRVGIYIAANIVIDQMEQDEEVDIFHAVKTVRRNRPQLVDNKLQEEYKYLYDLVLHYFISTAQGQKSLQNHAMKIGDGNAEHNLVNHWT